MLEVLLRLQAELGPGVVWLLVFSSAIVAVFVLYVGIVLFATLRATDERQAKIRYQMFKDLLGLFRRRSVHVIRLLEGYWWPVLDGPRQFLWKRLSGRCDRELGRLAELAAKPVTNLSANAIAERSRLERRRWRIPADPRYRMPTMLGNGMRAAEIRPWTRYGLDSVVCWPRLWLVLPDVTRQDISAARASLYLSAQAWTCAMLACVGVIWSWWALPLGIAAAAVIYYWPILGTARLYCDLVPAAYDVHRRLLYDALKWPYPANPSEERAQGIRLTLYLRAGSRDAKPTFTP